MKYTITLLLVILELFLFSSKAIAKETIVSDSAKFHSPEQNNSIDLREEILERFFLTHNSLLSDHAKEFIFYADKYNLDWRLLPAISGVESTFAKRIPFNSYNAYGWANGNYYFDSWEESIEHVSRYLKEKYLDRGATTVDKIAPIYAPPSKTWAWKVKFFMSEIDKYPIYFSLK